MIKSSENTNYILFWTTAVWINIGYESYLGTIGYSVMQNWQIRSSFVGHSYTGSITLVP